MIRSIAAVLAVAIFAAFGLAPALAQDIKSYINPDEFTANREVCESKTLDVRNVNGHHPADNTKGVMVYERPALKVSIIRFYQGRAITLAVVSENGKLTVIKRDDVKSIEFYDRVTSQYFPLDLRDRFLKECPD